MSLFEVSGLSHTFGEKPLYLDASFSIIKGEHLGVVGQNGTGKSTLIKILTGEIIPDAGQLKWQPRIKVGALGQYAEVDGAYTITQYLQTAFADLYAAQGLLDGLYQSFAENGDESLLAKAAACQEQLDASGFYSIDSEISRIIFGLGLDALGVDTPMQNLSGGQRAKVILAQLLLAKADLLLLDEPTNFLDKEHIGWLAGYLAAFSGAYVVVSHDFDFLERIATSICDIEFTSIRKYHGKYSDFLKQKGQLREDYIRQFNAQQKKIEKTEEYIRKNKAGVNSKMARGRQKQLDRLEKIAPPSFTSKPTIHIEALELTAQTVLTTARLEVGYYYALLPQLDFTVAGGQKVVITGFNGIGKSTLLKTLIGALPPVSGSFRFAESVRTGYYEQDLHWQDGNATPMRIISEAYPRLHEKQIRKHLSLCGVKADSALQPVCTLSGGEQSKVKLCRLLLSPYNFLILDEPTNHLDADTKEALQNALIHFSGSVLLVSHEESFYRGWADKVFSIEEYIR